jgi:hypothetical protein
MPNDKERPSDVEAQPDIETLDADRAKPPYGTTISKPSQKAGVEVGGGDKAAAANSKRAKDEGKADEAEPEDPDEAQSPT